MPHSCNKTTIFAASIYSMTLIEKNQMSAGYSGKNNYVL